MKKKIEITTIIAATSLLAMLGLVYCWVYSEPYYADTLGPHWAFWRQLIWNAIGVSAFVLASRVKWARWEKAGPFVLGGWMVAMFATIFWGQPSDAGLMLHVGALALDVMSVLPFVVALFLAWWMRQTKWRFCMLPFLMGIASGFMIAVAIATHPNRLLRVLVWLPDCVGQWFGVDTTALAAGMESPVSEAARYVLTQMKAAFAGAHWFSSGNVESLRNLPGCLTYSMTCASSVVLGYWFLLLVGLLFVALGIACASYWCTVADTPKRTFVLFAALGVVGSAFWGIGECFEVMPMRYTCVPLVAYGGTKVVLTWLTVGVLVSLFRDEDDGRDKRGR